MDCVGPPAVASSDPSANAQEVDVSGSVDGAGAAEVIRQTLERVIEAGTVRRVFGEPVERDGVLVVPVARVRSIWGVGAGGPADVGGVGTGGVITAGPVGVYEVRDGAVRWVPALDVNRVALVGQLAFIVAALVLRSVARGRRRE